MKRFMAIGTCLLLVLGGCSSNNASEEEVQHLQEEVDELKQEKEKEKEEKEKEKEKEEKEKEKKKEEEKVTGQAQMKEQKPLKVVDDPSKPQRIFGKGDQPQGHFGEYTVRVNAGYLALRNNTAFDASNEIAKLNNGDTVWLLDTLGGGDYWYVYAPSLGMYGYVNDNYLVQSGHEDQDIYYAKVDSGYLALRNAMAYDPANEIGQIQTGEPVQVLDTSTGQYWYVYSPTLNMYGYVDHNYLVQ